MNQLKSNNDLEMNRGFEFLLKTNKLLEYNLFKIYFIYKGGSFNESNAT